MKKALLLFLIFNILVFSYGDRFTVEKLWEIKRVGDPQISPDGKWIAYTITSFDMKTNKSNTDIWLISINGGKPIKLTEYKGYDGHPRWGICGKKIGFISDRKGKPQVFIVSIKDKKVEQLTNIPTGVSSFEWAPDGKYILFVASVYPGKSLKETALIDEQKEKSLVKAKIINKLLFRHWNHWINGKYKHVFLFDLNTKKVKDLTPSPYDCPPISLGGKLDYTISYDGETFYFVRNTDPMVAISTNNDIFYRKLNDNKIYRLTNTRGNDNSPVCSPDGQYLAYLTMKRPGFESDQEELVLLNLETGKKRILTENFDRDAGYPIFSPKGYIYFTTLNHHKRSIYRVNIETGKIEKIIDEHYNYGLQITIDGEKLVFLRESIDKPAEIFVANADGTNVKQLTFTNKEILKNIEMNPLKTFWFTTSDGIKVQGLLVLPPNFEPTKKYPTILLIHGGPQGAWSDDFHYRWNLSLFAAPGFVVVAINPRGSKGYGQKFCDAVSGDWGGAPYRDIMEGLDYAINKFPFIDENRIGAAGASYGGYMINWIEGHTNRFKCLVSHAGVSELFSEYGTTEELWFPEWEFRGTPYEHPELYQKFSPLNYAKNFKTPMLIIHGANDFRVPINQALQMFTALQRQGIPSKFIYFPDECHFITKPQNARLWWNEIHKWFKKWLCYK